MICYLLYTKQYVSYDIDNYDQEIKLPKEFKTIKFIFKNRLRNDTKI